MRPTTKLLRAGVLAIAATAVLAGPAAASSAHHGALFVQSDDPAGNTVSVYDRGGDGALHAAATYATGGLGGVLAGSVVDHLASQGSLALDREHHLLYAVNAGSDTLTVFEVDGDRLHREQVIGTGGRFPVSVAAHGHAVYVLNARNGGSIQGFLRLGDRLVRVPGWHRSLGLDPTLAPEFVNTPGQVAFSPRGNQLIVTTKSNGNQIDVFNLAHSGRPSASPVVTADPGGVPFAVTFDRTGRLDVAEAGPNAVASYVLHRDGTLTLVDRVLTGQAATCWITGTGRELFADNAGSATVSSFDVHAGGLTSRGTTATDAGTVDATVTSGGHYLYVQTGAAGIVDEFAIGHDGSLTAIGSVTVPGAVGGEGIASA
jgi:6-phosphogluconolactonase (cycloisomerase 2 family)